MKRTICLILIWSLAVGCSMLPFGKKETLPEPTPQQKAAEPREALASEEPPTLIETGTPLAPKSAEKPRQKIVKKTPPRPTYRKRKKLVLPTYLNAKDNTLMALITEGDYLVGGNLIPNYKRAFIPGLTQNKIQSFYIDQYEITVGNFKKYNPEYDEKPFYEGRECPTCPAMGIDWKSANKYCQRAGKRLPTESEWEAAARGPSNNHHWPWGDTWDPRFANILGKEDGFAMAAPAGSFPLGASPSGAMDMIGNVWEWVSATYSLPKSNPEKEDGEKRVFYTLKGGSWRSSLKEARISFRHLVEPDLKNPSFGFRCAKSILKVPEK